MEVEASRDAAPQGPLPVPSLLLVVDTVLHSGGCRSVRRRRDRLARLACL